MDKITELTYFEAAAIAADTQRKVFSEQYGLSGYVATDDYGLKFFNGYDVVPLRTEQMRAKCWSVEEEENWEEGVVWGVCDKNGRSLVFKNKPFSRENIGFPGWSWVEEKDGGLLLLNMPNLFTKEPQKYRFVLADEPTSDVDNGGQDD